MKVVIAGGTGFLGQEIARRQIKNNNNVVILTRGKSTIEGKIKYVNWDAKTEGEWSEALIGCDILVNLTGKSVDCRYTEKNKKAILNSRTDSTNILNTVVSKLEKKPRLWMNASAATIYKYSFDTPMTEESNEYGSDFAMQVAKSWEDAFYNVKQDGVRKVALRISLILGQSGGVYPVLKRLARFGLGGKAGSGRQRFAWIDIEDMLNAIDFIIENNEISGPVNCATVNTPTNAEFMKALRKSINMPIGLPQPAFIIKLGAFLIGTESDLVLKSRYVYPKKLVDHGFEFKHKTCETSLNSLSK